MQKQDLYIIDLNNVLYKLYYGLKADIRDQNGELINAFYGFCRLITKIAKKPESYVIICDDSLFSYKKSKYSFYKANRLKIPEPILNQKSKVFKFLQSINLACLRIKNLEADDLIFYIVNKYKDLFNRIYIISNDKDLYSLLDIDKVSIVNLDLSLLYNKEKFIKKFSFEPKYFPVYLALLGDNADNIKKIPSVGPKKAKEAVNYVKSYNVFCNYKINLTEVFDKKLAFLLKFKNQINYNLNIIKPILDISFCLNFNLLKIHESLLLQALKRLNFNSLIKNNNKETLKTKIDFNFKFDLNTSKALFYIDDKLMFLDEQQNENVILKLTNLSLLDLLKFFKTSDSIITFNFNYLLFVLLKQYKLCFCLENLKVIDLQIIYRLLNSDEEINFKYLLLKYNLNLNKLNYLDIKNLSQQLILNLKNNNLSKLLELESKVNYVLYKIQSKGLKINLNKLNDLILHFEDKIYFLKKEIFRLSGTDFNINSPKQLLQILKTKFNITNIKNTSVLTLKQIQNICPVAKLILEYRENFKLLTNYLKKYTKLALCNRLYTHYVTIGTATGRIISKDPNFQNIPNKIHVIFSSDTQNDKLLSLDYSQIELRILAHFSQDPVLLDFFANNEDVHRWTAQLVFGDPNKRSEAKAIGFGIIYGLSAKGLADILNIHLKEAKIYIDKYFKTFKKVKEFIDNTINFASHNGYVLSLFGRKRYLPNINSQNKILQKSQQRIAVNSVIQMSAADIFKKALVDIDNFLRINNLKTTIVMQIYDEIVLNVKANELCYINKIKDKLQDIIDLKVPLIVNVRDFKQ